ncbi:MAG: HAD-IIA family hydrolase, partial [Thiohalocapsa sp.]
MATEAPIDALLLDMDGVLYHGNAPLPGAADFLRGIAHIPHLFVTNNPIRTPEQVAERFEAIGLPRPEPEQILTSAAAPAAWLATERPGFRFFAVGADGLHRALRSAGGRGDRQQADFVVVGEGPGLDFDSLCTGIDLIVKHGARLVVTNPDTSVDDHHDGRHRVLPGGGALVAPFALASGVEPIVIGKPEPALFRMALARLGLRFGLRLGLGAERCVMIGDRPDTDIAGAVRCGIRAALVRTGRFAPGEPWPNDLPRPHWDRDTLDALAADLLPLLPKRLQS